MPSPSAFGSVCFGAIKEGAEFCVWVSPMRTSARTPGTPARWSVRGSIPLKLDILLERGILPWIKWGNPCSCGGDVLAGETFIITGWGWEGKLSRTRWGCADGTGKASLRGKHWSKDLNEVKGWVSHRLSGVQDLWAEGTTRKARAGELLVHLENSKDTSSLSGPERPGRSGRRGGWPDSGIRSQATVSGKNLDFCPSGCGMGCRTIERFGAEAWPDLSF